MGGCKGRRARLEVVYEDLPGGRRALIDRVVFPNSVSVLPVYPSRGTVVLIRQYRPVVKQWIYEVPAGTLKEGESPEEAARRELEEEAGLVGGRLMKLGEGFLAPGYSTEYMHFYAVEEPYTGKPRPEEHEVIEVVEIPYSKALSMLSRGEIRDAKTMLSLLLYKYKGG